MTNSKTELEKAIVQMQASETGWGDREERFKKTIIEICNEYAEFACKSPVEVFNAIENIRSCSYPNWYTRNKYPPIKDIMTFEYTSDLFRQIDYEKGFRCPSCNGISKDPYTCDTGIVKNYRDVCDWKSWGLFGTLGKGLRFTVFERFLSKPYVDEIFYPVCMEEEETENGVQT